MTPDLRVDVPVEDEIHITQITHIVGIKDTSRTLCASGDILVILLRSFDVCQGPQVCIHANRLTSRLRSSLRIFGRVVVKIGMLIACKHGSSSRDHGRTKAAQHSNDDGRWARWLFVFVFPSETYRSQHSANFSFFPLKSLLAGMCSLASAKSSTSKIWPTDRDWSRVCQW